jgi:hypothetical protein
LICKKTGRRGKNNVGKQQVTQRYFLYKSQANPGWPSFSSKHTFEQHESKISGMGAKPSGTININNKTNKNEVDKS